MNLNRCHPSITWRVARAATIRYRLCVSSNSPDVRSCNALRVKNNPHQLFHPPSHQCRTFATKSKKALSAAKSNGKKATFTKSNSNKAAPTRYYPRKKAAAAKQLNVVKEDIGNDKQAPSNSTFGNINEVFQCCTNQDKMNGLHSSEIVELWSSIPRLLKRERAVNDKKAHHGGNQLQMIQSVRRLMERTTFIIDECDQNELTDIVVYLGRAVHEVKNAREGSSVYHNVFRELFFDNNHPDADVLDKELFKPLAAAARGRLPMFHPRELARLSQSYAMMEHNPQFEDGATLLGETAFETIIRVDDFSPKGAADTLHAFAKMELPANSLLFQSVGDSIADRHGLDALPPSTIAQIVSAYATSQIPHQKLFDRIGDSICERNDLASFKPSELSEILHSYASLNQEHSAMFQKIGDSIVLSKDLGIMRKFQTKDLVSALWSFSKLHESHPGLFAKIADAILKLNDRNALSSEELATVLWAYATDFERNDFVWSSSYKSLFKKLGDIFAFRDLSSCSLESINNALWAYATCSISHPILFEKVGDALTTSEDLASFAPHILWAYTTLNESHPVLSDLKKVMRDNDFLAELSTMTLAKTLFPNEQELELFMKVADHLAKRDDLSSLGSQSILNVLNACTNIKVAHSGLLQAVGDTLSLRNDWKSSDASFLSEIVWAFAACDENHPPLFKVIGDVFIKAGSSASELDTEDCVRLMWACAAANTSQPNVFSEIKDAIAAKESDRYQFLVKELGVILVDSKELASFDSPCLVDLVCAVTSINTSHLSSLKGVGDILASRDDLTALSTQTLSNLLWSYTNTKSDHPPLFQKVGDVLSTRDDLSISHEVLSRIISSFTRHPAKPHIALLKRIGEVVEHDVDISSSKLSEDVLLDLLLSLSAIESTWPGLLRRIGDLIASRDVDMRIIRPRLTNILLAYTNAGASHPSLFRILAESNPSVFDNFLVQAVNEGFMPRVLLGLASAFASADQKLLRHDKTELFTRIGDAAVHHYKDIGIIPQFSIEDVTNIIAAYNHAKVRHSPLFQLIGDALTQTDDATSLTHKQIWRLVSAYTETNELHAKLFHRISESIHHLGGIQTFDHIAYIVRAFVIQDVDFHMEFSDDFVSKVCKLEAPKLRSFHLWHLWRTGEKSAPGLPTELQQLCQEAFISTDAHHTYSGFHNEVNRHLEAMGLEQENEFRSKSGYAIDILVKLSDTEVVGLEVDGPHHFERANQNDANSTYFDGPEIINTGRKPTARTMLRRRLIPCNDQIPLRSIPYWEWAELKGSESKQHYLRSLIGLDEGGRC